MCLQMFIAFANLKYFFIFTIAILMHENVAQNRRNKLLNVLINNYKNEQIGIHSKWKAFDTKPGSFKVNRYDHLSYNHRGLKSYNSANIIQDQKEEIKLQNLKPKSHQNKVKIAESNNGNLKDKKFNDTEKNLNIKFVNDDIKEYVDYRRDVPLIWVMGPPRSGTSLLRVMLDAHKDVRCNEEIPLINRLFNLHRDLFQNGGEGAAMGKLEEANINMDVLYNAMGAYILTIASQHGDPAKWICSAEPQLMVHGEKLLRMFPHSKFLLVVRDGRAVVQSISNRRIGHPALSINPLFHRANLHRWSEMVSEMVDVCNVLGSDICLKVKYERLVLQPTVQMKEILTWLGVPFDHSVLQHEKTIGQPSGTKLSGSVGI